LHLSTFRVYNIFLRKSKTEAYSLTLNYVSFLDKWEFYNIWRLTPSLL